MTSIAEAIPSFGANTLEGFDTTGVQPGQRIPGIKRQYVRFYKKIIPQVYATEVYVNPKTGSTQVLKTDVRNVEKEMVHIVTPGDNNNIVDDFAEDFHKREHWQAYKNFRDGKTAPLGKDIDECSSYISPHAATELRYRGVHTEEQLADASDLLCSQIASGFDLREFARACCKASQESKSLTQVLAMKGELEQSRKLIADLQAQINQINRNPSGVILSSSGEALPPSEIRVAPKKKTWSRKKKIVPVTVTEPIGV